MHAFRGVPGEMTVDFGKGESLVVYGDNGTGKSTIADALEWYFLGEIELLSHEGRQHAVRHVGSETDGETSVEVFTSGMLGGKVVFPDGRTPETFHAFRRETFLLRGRTLADFINKSKTEKWKALVEILGLDAIESLREDLQRARNDLRKQSKLAEEEVRTYARALASGSGDVNHETVLTNLQQICEMLGVDPPQSLDQVVEPSWLTAAVGASASVTEASGRESLLTAFTSPNNRRIKKFFMCKLKPNPEYVRRRMTSVCRLSAAFLLTTFLLPTLETQAQPCGNLLSIGPITDPVSGSKVVVGQTVQIPFFRASSAAGNCLFKNGEAFYASPDGTVTKVMQNLSLDPGETFSCSPSGGAQAECLPYVGTYVVNAADINRTLTIVLPPRGQFGGGTSIQPGTPGQIHFFGAGDVDGFDPNSPDPNNPLPTGAGQGQSFQFLIVVNPLIDITKDAQQAKMNWEWDPRPVAMRGYRPKLTVAKGELAKAVDLIKKAKKPVILAGQGILQSGAMAEVRQFAERINAPVALTLLGLGSFPASHRLNIGMMGMHGEAWVNHAIQEADLLMAFGMRFDDRVTGNTKTYAPTAKKIHVDIDPSEINKNIAVDAAIVADLRETLKDLLDDPVPLVAMNAALSITRHRSDLGRPILLAMLEPQYTYLAGGLLLAHAAMRLAAGRVDPGDALRDQFLGTRFLRRRHQVARAFVADARVARRVGALRQVRQLVDDDLGLGRLRCARQQIRTPRPRVPPVQVQLQGVIWFPR